MSNVSFGKRKHFNSRQRCKIQPLSKVGILSGQRPFEHWVYFLVPSERSPKSPHTYTTCINGKQKKNLVACVV